MTIDDVGDDSPGPTLPLASGTTAAAARAAGHPTRIVPTSVPSDFRARVSVTVKERLTFAEHGRAITIEQVYSVEWLSPAAWVKLVVAALAQGPGPTTTARG